MAKRLSVLVALGALLAGTAAAQDVERVLRAAADAMGDPSNVTYSGTGWVANIGQSYTPDDDCHGLKSPLIRERSTTTTVPLEKNIPGVRATIHPKVAERLYKGNNGACS